MSRIKAVIKILSAYFVRLNFNINSYEFKKIYQNNLVYFFNDTLSNEISIFGIYEKAQLNKIIDIIRNKKKRVCIDIGANIGNHSLFFSKFFKKVFSFEPHPKVFPLLKINSEKSKNIKAFNLALSDKEGHLYFWDLKTHNMAGHSLKSQKQKKKKGVVGAGGFKIKIKKLDNIIKDRRIDFVKIDTEGHEYKVLVGMRKMLITNNPIIMFEFDAKQYSQNHKIIKYLNNLNYKYFYFFDQDYDYYNYRMRNLIFLFIKILIFGLKNNKIYLKKITDFKNQKNYFKDTLICSKYDLNN